jgi:hypothetical protein
MCSFVGPCWTGYRFGAASRRTQATAGGENSFRNAIGINLCTHAVIGGAVTLTNVARLRNSFAQDIAAGCAMHAGHRTG